MKTIHFVDYGQDCLSWDINDEGLIVACRPYNDPYFVGKKLLNSETVERGDFATIETCDPLTGLVKTKFITYPINEVYHHHRQKVATD